MRQETMTAAAYQKRYQPRATPPGKPMTARQVKAAQRKEAQMAACDALRQKLLDAGFPEPASSYTSGEVHFAEALGRDWAFDFAYPACGLAIEVEGGVWSGGRHVRGKGYEGDCEKYSVASLLGWVLVRVTPGMINDGTALHLIKCAYWFWHGRRFRDRITRMADAVADHIEAHLQSDADWLREYEKIIPPRSDAGNTPLGGDDITQEDEGEIWTAEDQWREQIQNR